MAVDLSTATTLPFFDNITLGAADVLTKVSIPADTGRFSMYFRAKDGKLQFTTAGLSDGGALTGDYLTIPRDSWVEIRVGADKEKTLPQVTDFYLASGNASVVVEVLIEPST